MKPVLVMAGKNYYQLQTNLSITLNRKPRCDWNPSWLVGSVVKLICLSILLKISYVMAASSREEVTREIVIHIHPENRYVLNVLRSA